MDKQIDRETIKELSDIELQKLVNLAWSEDNLEVCWLCDQESLRRRKAKINVEN